METDKIIPVEEDERSDGQMPMEDDADPEPPDGSFQTRDYYLDSSCRRRRSLERSSFVRRPSFEFPDARPAPAVAIGNSGGLNTTR
ncbi:hypothetical protein ACP70R_025615 [Stipagrostis hirtigluma subsp. patula]